MDLDQLRKSGWLLLDGISSQADIMEIGNALGTPVAAPNGEMVKEIRGMPAIEAPPGSQSSIYGTGPFPLHTDTVFWPMPVRYVILRARGDTRRPTTVVSFSELLHECDARFHELADRSVWLAEIGPRRFYCSLRFRASSLLGWRYDADLMSPANAASIEVDRILRPLVTKSDVPTINWSGSNAAVLSNWTVLHGRGPAPPDEGTRTIERLYVR